MVKYNSLADALEVEVLTQMADTFFGARKNLDDLAENFKLQVEELRSREGLVISRVLFLRSLFLGQEGEKKFYGALGLAPPFENTNAHSGSRTWQPDSIPFALFASSRFEKLVQQTYAQIHHACEVYMVGEYIEDSEQKGRKRLTLNYQMVVQLWQRLNDRMEKLNNEMTPSSVLQYARSMRNCEQNGQGALTCSLGAQSLDSGLEYHPIPFESLQLWQAPVLPHPDQCAPVIKTFCKGFYEAHSAEIKERLAELT